MGKFQDITGQEFFGVRVEYYVGNGRWHCRCSRCGSEFDKRTAQIKLHGCSHCRKNTINEEYFAKIDSGHKAYFLGFLWADGYVNSKALVCKLDLQKRDKDILEKLKQATNFSGKINTVQVKKGQSYRPADTFIWRVVITNKGFVKNLVELGLVAHREQILPQFDKIPASFMCDFFRGYFDGNGSISIDAKNRPLVSLCGGAKLIRYIGQWLSAYGIDCKYYQRKPDNPDNLTLVITARKNQKKFLELLYNNANLYLQRKYEKYLEVISLI